MRIGTILVDMSMSRVFTNRTKQSQILSNPNNSVVVSRHPFVIFGAHDFGLIFGYVSEVAARRRVRLAIVFVRVAIVPVSKMLASS